jgi:phage-related protein
MAQAGGIRRSRGEVVEDHDGNTYRAVYTVKLSDAIYVLHAFLVEAGSGAARCEEQQVSKHDFEKSSGNVFISRR